MELTEKHIKYIKDLFKNRKPKKQEWFVGYTMKKELDKIFKEEFNKHNKTK